MNVTEFLASKGLHADKSYNTMEVFIKDAHGKVVATLGGGELVKEGKDPKGSDMFFTQEETIELIKQKLPA